MVRSLVQENIEQFIFWESNELGETSWVRARGWATPLRATKPGSCRAYTGTNVLTAEFQWGALNIWPNKQAVLLSCNDELKPCQLQLRKGQIYSKSQCIVLNAPFFHAEASSLLYGVSSHRPAEQQQEELTYSCYCQVKTVCYFRTTPQETCLK